MGSHGKGHPGEVNGETRTRGAGGRFWGPRVNVEDGPRLPAYVARYALEDPRARPYLVAWTDRRYGDRERVRLAFKVEPREGGRVRFLAPGLRETVGTVRVPIPGGRAALLWRCPRCARPARFLYVHRLSGANLWEGSPGCARCNGLRWGSQGRPLGGWRGRPLARHPWDPAAVVSSPAVLEATDPARAEILLETPTGGAYRVPTAREMERLGKDVARISRKLGALMARVGVR